MEPKFIPGFVIYDLGRGFAFVFATAVLGIALGRALVARIRKKESDVTPALVFASYLVAAFVASTTTRLHPGSWDNNLIHWIAFASPAFAFVVTNLGERARTFACALAALQVIYFVPSPSRSIPSAESKQVSDEITARVRALETNGEVVLLTRGHVTSKRHAHYQAINDLLIAKDPLPEDLRSGLESRTYAAFIVDELARLDFAQPFGTRDDIFDLVARNYFVAERLPEGPPPIIGHGSVPRWVLRPRSRKLELDHASLVNRILRESALAAMDHGEGLDIETRAAE
jgi:hypothetical protein